MKFIKQIGATLLALILLCGVAFGIGWGVTGTYDITKWGKQEANLPVDGEEGNNGNNGSTKTETNDNLIVSIEDNESIRIMRTRIAPDEFEAYGVSEQAESAFTLTATVKDIHGNTPATMQYVKFEMPEGASESVKMTVVDDVTARFECLKAFGTYIDVKVSSTLDTSKFTTVKLGYRPDIASVHIVWNTSNSSSFNIENIDVNVLKEYGFTKKFLPMNEYGNFNNSSHRLGLKITNDMVNWGVGTETLSYDTVNVKFVPTGSVISQLEYALGEGRNVTSYTETFTVRGDEDIRYVTEDRLFIGLGLTYDDVFDYLSILDSNITHDFRITFTFSNSETGEEWAIDLMLAVSVPVIGGVGGVTTDKDTIIFN